MKKRTKINISILTPLFALLVLGGTYWYNKSSTPDEDNRATIAQSDTSLYKFIITHLMDKSGGIYTNLRSDLPKEPHLAKNHDMLLESTGLLLEYALLTNRRYLFDQQLHFITQHLQAAGGLLRWKYDGPRGEKAKTNASLDDLRVIRNLLNAHDKWGDESYQTYALLLGDALLKANRQGDLLVDYYDIPSKYRANQVTISYLDVPTMKRLAAFNPEWLAVKQASEALLTKAQMPSGLYMKTHDLKSNQWVPGEGKYNAIDSLIAAYHAAEAGISITPTINWLQQTWAKDRQLYAHYSEKGHSADQVESPAAYAIAARLAHKVNLHELEAELTARMQQFAVQDPNSEYVGGYVDLPTLQCYSFDNLQALLVQAERNASHEK
ncbi:glycosyl hydrolase family 8 [Paenibacillus sp. N1-5-1-14]|uniref:glycosyl hydrolase family 8 n=1 Tax=Paenibacillus radicibacter TaxID=2972488 RepID=UPI002158F855|nr:glycosyl hydrolase family 8 [Paenibacillus radicibacter]MCR8643122.1 glycosyl hydrolase family 8 [Paenibacillus radicibacter]